MNTEVTGLSADKSRGTRREKFSSLGLLFAERGVGDEVRNEAALATTRNIISLRQQWEVHIELYQFKVGKYVRHHDGWVGRIDRITPKKQLIVDGKQYSPLMFESFGG